MVDAPAQSSYQIGLPALAGSTAAESRDVSSTTLTIAMTMGQPPNVSGSSLSAAMARHALVRRDYSFGPTIIGVQWTLVAIAVVITACRIYIRSQNRKLGLDDLAIAIATACTIFGAIGATLFAHNGMGTHLWDLGSQDVSHATKWLLIDMFQSYTALFFVRLSIGFFILRMLAEKKSHRTLTFIVYFCLFLNFGATLSAIIIEAVWCRPLRAVWETVPGAKCISPDIKIKGVRALAIISAIIDIFFATLPILVFCPFRMPWKTKRNLMLVMLLALIVCACAVAKAVMVNASSRDFTWSNGINSFWVMLEVNLGIIVASLPAMRKFYFSVRNDISSLRSKKSTSALFNNNDRYEASSWNERRSPMRMSQARNRVSDAMTDDSDINKRHTISIKHEIAVEESLDSPSTSSQPALNDCPIWAGHSGNISHSARAESLSVRGSRH